MAPYIEPHRISNPIRHLAPRRVARALGSREGLYRKAAVLGRGCRALGLPQGRLPLPRAGYTRKGPGLAEPCAAQRSTRHREWRKVQQQHQEQQEQQEQQLQKKQSSSRAAEEEAAAAVQQQQQPCSSSRSRSSSSRAAAEAAAAAVQQHQQQQKQQ